MYAFIPTSSNFARRGGMRNGRQRLPNGVFRLRPIRRSALLFDAQGTVRCAGGLDRREKGPLAEPASGSAPPENTRRTGPIPDGTAK